MALTIKHRVTLDLSLTSVQATVPFRKGDTAAHEVIFNLRNGTTNVELPVGSVATIAVLNGYEEYGVLDACVVDHVNNQINYIPTVNALKVAGNIACELVVIGPYGETLGAPRFHFLVDESMTKVTEEEIAEALKASTSWDVIQQTAAKADAAAQSAEAAAQSAEAASDSASDASTWEQSAFQSKLDAVKSEDAAKMWAVGYHKNGGPAVDGEPQYRNNAKHYADESKSARVTTYEYLTAAQEAAGEAKQAAAAIKAGAASISVDLDDKNYELTVALKDANGDTMGDPVTVDFPVESSVTNIEYDSTGKDLIFTLRNGNKTTVPLDGIIAGLATVTQLNAGLAQKVGITTDKSRIYGTDSSGKATLYIISGETGNGTNVIMPQAAVTAALTELARRITEKSEALTALATKVGTHTTEILALDEKQSEHETRITELEKSGGGGSGGDGSSTLYDAEIPVGEVANGKMVSQNGAVANDSASCATDFIAINPGSTLYIENCFVQYGRCICTYDAETKLRDVIAGPVSGDTITVVTYIVPDDVRYIRITAKVNETPQITKINFPINSDIKFLSDSIGKTNDAIVENNSQFGLANLPVGELVDNTFILYSNGKTSNNNDSAATDFIAVAPFSKVTIKKAFLSGNRSICGYDGGKQYVQYFAYDTSNTEYVIESVPPSVKYIRVTCRSGIAPFVTQEAIVTMGNIYIPPITIVGEFESGYLKTDGKTVISNNSYSISPYIAVEPHQEIEVRNFMALGNGALYCYDANQNLVKRFEESFGSFKSQIYQLSFNTHYIRVHTGAGDESKLSINYTKRAHHDAAATELVNKWFDGAHGKIDKLFNTATKKPIITFIDDDTTSVEGVKRFRDICMELGIRGTYACITSRLDNDSALKDTLLEYQNEGFHIVMHAHSEHGLYAEVALRLPDSPPTEEELKTLERDFVTCISRLKSFGFLDTNFWISPGGSHGYVNDDLMRKWGINCYVTCGNDRLDYEGTNPKRGRYGLVRPSIGPDDTSGSQTLAEVKTIIDNASIDNGWVLVCTHMAQGGWADESARNRFKELVNYARDKGFEVRTLNDAWRIREPIYRLYETF